jgi:Domain of unknown function (DUF4170)
MTAKEGAKKGARQLLHLVFGGELTTLDRIEFSDLKKLDIVGIYRITRRRMTRGRMPLTAPLTMPICAISSCICTGCSTLSTIRRRGPSSANKASGFSP